MLDKKPDNVVLPEELRDRVQRTYAELNWQLRHNHDAGNLEEAIDVTAEALWPHVEGWLTEAYNAGARRVVADLQDSCDCDIRDCVCPPKGSPEPL
jgi:hypothetical protein